jgi:CDP-diacylglycerol--glycerol-3-phosphate 3-phosphatidyltransferase
MAAPHPTNADSTPGSNRFLTASNLLSISRVVLTIPFVLVMFSTIPSSRLWAALIISVAILTDKLDGVIARRYNQITEWGKILDPVADKIAVGVVAIVLIHFDAIPVWFLAAILVRDVLILVGGIYIKSARGVVLPSKETGKWAVGIISLALFVALVGIQSVLLDVLLWASVVMLVVSFSLYVVRFIETLKG